MPLCSSELRYWGLRPKKSFKTCVLPCKHFQVCSEEVEEEGSQVCDGNQDSLRPAEQAQCKSGINTRKLAVWGKKEYVQFY